MDMREAFTATADALLDEREPIALVLADISAAEFAGAIARHPDRVINVGIREQLMVGVAGGLALTGLRPVLHSYATFAVDRAYEQLKLDLGHQGVGAVVVTVGASYDASPSGRTHHSPGDVALLDTLTGWTVHVPGHPAEVAPLLRAAAERDDRVYIRLATQSNERARDGARLVPARHGSRATVLAVGPMLDPVLAATEGLDVTVAYTNTPRPLDAAGLLSLVDGTGGTGGTGGTSGTGTGTADVVLVEPYLAGTSAAVLSGVLRDRPHRLLALGVGSRDLRMYGSIADHAARHGLDPAGLRRSITDFLG
jgi:transketolase